MNYLFVGVGGILGAISRYSVGKFVSQRWRGSFPIGTFIINLSGAFALGFLGVLFTRFFPDYGNLKVMVTTGFLGAYTTFSTFTYEAVGLIEAHQYLQAFRYVGLSILLGILFAFAGLLIIQSL